MHPFEGNVPEDPKDEPQAASRPMPCPECESTRGFVAVGKFRSQCLSCNALVRNEEINPEKE